MPRTQYFPPGTLREALAYPATVNDFTDEACQKALERLGLGRLSTQLDARGRWDLSLTEGEQHSLAFASVLLHAPRWLVMDEALESLEDEQRPKIMEVLAKDLVDTGILYIGRALGQDDLFTRTIHLEDDAEALKLGEKPSSADAPAASTAAAAT